MLNFFTSVFTYFSKKFNLYAREYLENFISADHLNQGKWIVIKSKIPLLSRGELIGVFGLFKPSRCYLLPYPINEVRDSLLTLGDLGTLKKFSLTTLFFFIILCESFFNSILGLRQSAIFFVQSQDYTNFYLNFQQKTKIRWSQVTWMITVGFSLQIFLAGLESSKFSVGNSNKFLAAHSWLILS